ncbi:MAG: biotin synthase BioB [Gammaproteobacteria bacterium]
MLMRKSPSIRHNWTKKETLALLQQPFNDLLHRAQQTHRYNFDPNKVQLSTLMNIKSGGCPEDCAYCPQSSRYQTGVEAEKLAAVQDVESRAQSAKDKGATRFCMGAAWRQPKQRDLDKVISMVKAVKKMKMETCVTLGMLSRDQAEQLKAAGLDYYNHNIDSSPEYYTKIITTRDYDERLETLEHVRDAGINVCCGGIIGMGESIDDRADFLLILANMPSHPESVPINMLVKVEGTPLNDVETIDPIDFIRIIASARIMMPKSYVRLSAGRNEMSDEMQALSYLAGANSIFYGEKLLTTNNPQLQQDRELLKRLGIEPSENYSP